MRDERTKKDDLKAARKKRNKLMNDDVVVERIID